VYEDLFLPSHCCLTPPSWGTPCDINAVYTSLKSTFSWLQFRCWHYRSIFIRLAVIASETPEMPRNARKIWPYSSSRSSKVIDLGVNGKPIYDFLLVVNCNFSRYLAAKGRGRVCKISSFLSLPVNISATVCEIFTGKDRKLLILHTRPLFDVPLREPLRISGRNLPHKN